MNAISNPTTKRDRAPSKPSLSRAGRRVRGGIFGHDPQMQAGAKQIDASMSLANFSRDLAQQLNGIAASELLTPAEKRTRSASVVAEFAQRRALLQQKLDGAVVDVLQRVEQLENVRHAYEQKLGPISVERIRRRADALVAAGPDARAKAWEDAARSRRLDDVLALSLTEPLNPARGERLFLELTRNDELQAVERDLAHARRIAASGLDLERGLAELQKADDPYLGDSSNAGDLFNLAGGHDLPELAPTLPSWVRQVAQ